MKKLFTILTISIFLSIAIIPIYSQEYSPWPMFLHDIRHNAQNNHKGPEFPYMKWKYETLGSSVVIGADGGLYFCSYDGNLVALDSEGNEKWKVNIDYNGRTAPAVGNDGSVYIGTGNFFYSFNPDGQENWKIPSAETSLWNPPWSSPIIDEEGIIFIGSWDNHIYAIYPHGEIKWSFKTGDWVTSTPAIDENGVLYCGSDDHNLYAINPDGSLKWRFKTDGAIVSSPAIGLDETIYIGSSDEHFYAVNQDGSEKWRYKTTWTVISSPAVGNDGTIYFGSGKLYNDNPNPDDYPFIVALNPDGSIKWRFKTPYNPKASPAIGSDGTIYIGTWVYLLKYGFFYALNPDGSEKWRFKTISAIDSSPAIGADGTLYFCSVAPSSPLDQSGRASGYLYAIGESENRISMNLSNDPKKSEFTKGENLKIQLDLQTALSPVNADIYLVMLKLSTNELFFGLNWDNEPVPVLSNFLLPEKLSLFNTLLLDINILEDNIPFESGEDYLLGIVATEPGTLDFVSNLATVDIIIK